MNHLYIHIFIHETIIADRLDFQGYKDKDVYIDLGVIEIGDDYIKMNPRIIVPYGSNVHMNDGILSVSPPIEKSLFQRFLDLFR